MCQQAVFTVIDNADRKKNAYKSKLQRDEYACELQEAEAITTTTVNLEKVMFELLPLNNTPFTLDGT
eukprot:gene5143-8783_t